MRFSTPISIESLAQQIGAELVLGDFTDVLGLNEIHFVVPGDLVFVDHPKYYTKALSSQASFILIDQKPEQSFGKTLLIHPKPFQAFNAIIQAHTPIKKQETPISSKTNIGQGTIIQPNVFISENARVGNNCFIHPGVVIESNVYIGDRVIIHANTVIGSDAFYYNKKEGKYTKFISCGDVVIEDDVEIGALCTIDKGVTATTRIGSGTKLDNQVHIGHDTSVGKNCLFAAQVAIAGVCEIHDQVILWGQVGVSSNVVIEQNVVVFAQSGVSKTLKAGKTYFGSPADEASKRMKEMALVRQLPAFFSTQKR